MRASMLHRRMTNYHTASDSARLPRRRWSNRHSTRWKDLWLSYSECGRRPGVSGVRLSGVNRGGMCEQGIGLIEGAERGRVGQGLPGLAWRRGCTRGHGVHPSAWLLARL